jgi:hypothetical protein
MVLEDPLWQDGNDYPARLDRQFIEDVFDVEGVIKPAGGALKVSPRAAGANMSVDVAAGRAVVRGDDEANQGHYRVISTAVENLPIGAAPGSDSRIDLIVARVRDAAVTGGVSSDWLLEVIPGAVAAAPVAPAVPPTAIPLAEVSVAAGTASIDAAKITDRRTAAANAAYLAKTQNLADVPDKAAARTNLDVAPLSATNIAVLGAGALAAARGAPSLAGVATHFTGWLLDAASTESVSSQVVVPQHWKTMDVECWYTNPGTGSGNVVLRSVLAASGGITGGGTLSVGAQANVTDTAPAQNALRKVRLAANVTVTSGEMQLVNVERIGGDAADTLGNDMAVLAIILRRVS